VNWDLYRLANWVYQFIIKKLTNKEWKCIEDRFEKKLSCWKGKLISYEGRLILINSVLTSMPMFLLSFFEVPVGVRKRLDFYRSRFFWQRDEIKTKYRLAKWDIIYRPKDQGGLGIENLEVKNRCLFSKWLYRLSVEDDGMWVQLLRNKYLHSKTLAQVMAQPHDSPFWKGLMRTKVAFFNRTKFTVGKWQHDKILGRYMVRGHVMRNTIPFPLQYCTTYGSFH
jgi:hypothetical protein